MGLLGIQTGQTASHFVISDHDPCWEHVCCCKEQVLPIAIIGTPSPAAFLPSLALPIMAYLCWHTWRATIQMDHSEDRGLEGEDQAAQVGEAVFIMRHQQYRQDSSPTPASSLLLLPTVA